MAEQPHRPPHNDRITTLVDELIADQQSLTAVEAFSRWHHSVQPHPSAPDSRTAARYSKLIPSRSPVPGEQFAFEVNLDDCSGCKACVTACHTLNGLDDSEAWREVGVLLSNDTATPWQQTVTSACHHCIDPACLNGCPVLAYEKDPITGIVRHLDDQCIGCQYCVLKCPYEVPKFSAKRGIVRKCDMCSQRLAAHEAPACAQACPNQAIKISIVNQADAAAALLRSPKDLKARLPRPSLVPHPGPNSFLPSSPDPQITLPSTRYHSSRPIPASVVPGDLGAVHVSPAHWPLVLMLVLSQVAVGCLTSLLLTQPQQHPTTSIAASIFLGLALVSSIFHLGRPLQAWRSFLGWRSSWLSREILVFGALAPLTFAATFAHRIQSATIKPFAELLSIACILLGWLAVVCSAMIYHDTSRASWYGWRTFSRFFGTSLIATSACFWVSSSATTAFSPWPAIVLALLTVSKLALENRSCNPSTPLSHEPFLGFNAQCLQSDRVTHGPLARLHRFRIAAGVLGGVVIPIACVLAQGTHPAPPIVSATLLLSAELLERLIFFQSVSSRRMPGPIASPSLSPR